jgi:hypothetical protein
MTSIFTSLPVANQFEVIRDHIAAVIAFELTSIGALDSSFVVPTVCIERMFPVDNTECPLVNVTFSDSSYSNKSAANTTNTATYNIYIYTNSPTISEDGTVTDGDRLAMIKLQQIAGYIRLILESMAYFNLDFDTPTITSPSVTSFQILTKDTVKDALASVFGVLTYQVKCTEQNQSLTFTDTVSEFDTRIKLNTNNQGLYITIDL